MHSHTPANVEELEAARLAILRLMPAALIEELKAKANAITDRPTDWRREWA